MTEAKSTDPKVWVSPRRRTLRARPGTQCSDYKACVDLLNAGKQIDYQGAGGDDNFNANHNVFSGFSVVGFKPDLTNTDGTYVTRRRRSRRPSSSTGVDEGRRSKCDVGRRPCFGRESMTGLLSGSARTRSHDRSLPGHSPLISSACSAPTSSRSRSPGSATWPRDRRRESAAHAEMAHRSSRRMRQTIAHRRPEGAGREGNLHPAASECRRAGGEHAPGVLGRLGFPWATAPRSSIRAWSIARSRASGRPAHFPRRPAYDQIIQGLAGMASVTGFPGDDPVRAGFPIADTVGGFAGAMAICAALVGREPERRRLLHGCVDARDGDRRDGLGRLRINCIMGRPPGRIGNDNTTSSPSGTFRTGDGGLNIAANAQAQFEALCVIAGCES